MKEENTGLNYPSIDDLLEVLPSKFQLAYAAARRAKIIDVDDYSPISEECDSIKSVGIALEEIISGDTKITFEEDE